MRQLCEIGIKISLIKANKSPNGKDEDLYAEKIFEVLHPYATEYRKLEWEYGLLPEYFCFHPEKKIMPKPILNLEDAIKKISQHPLVCWLNKQPGFVQAKKKIVKENLIVAGDPGIEVIKKYRNSFTLEYICSLVIYYFTNDKNKLTQIITTKAKLKPIDTAMRKLRYELKKGGGIYFHEESKQHLLLYLLDEWLKYPNQNVYSSEKSHPHLIRHFLTKKIMQCLFTIFGQEISNTLVVDIALDTTSIFFTRPMDRSDASIEAKKILNNLIQDNRFKQQTIGDILSMLGLKLMKF